jgi:16S rRNA (uracil1498-N3)-methyltransferase
MAIKSVYLPEPVIESGCLRILGDEHQHLKVARAEEGEAVEVFDGRGGVWTGKVQSSDKRETLVEVLESRHVAQSGPELILGLSLVKPAAFELALEKAVEVGVSRIVPIIASRSNVASRRSDRWTRIILEAAKQSKRYHLPGVDEPVRFESALDYPATTKIVFAERGGGPLKSALAGRRQGDGPAFFLIGPEGGWTDAELDAAQQKGFALVGLGGGILRTETAAIVGAALIRYELDHTS